MSIKIHQAPQVTRPTWYLLSRAHTLQLAGLHRAETYRLLRCERMEELLHHPSLLAEGTRNMKRVCHRRLLCSVCFLASDVSAH